MAIESAGMGSWDWDTRTDVVRYLSPLSGPNGRTLELRASTGADWFRMTHPDDIPKGRSQVDRAMNAEAESFSMVVRMRQSPSDETWRWIQSRGKVVARDTDGRALRLVGIFEDVTDEVKRDELARERELTLSRSGRLASLAALATSVAHELNQPLAALTSYLDASSRLLENGKPDLEEIGRALERSAALAEKASEIVRRLRRLLRREQPLQEPIELPAFLEGIRDSLSREAAAAGVSIDVERNAARLTIRGDLVQIEQALVNLVRNAIEALAESERRPRRILLGVKRSRGLVRISVADNGPGVSDADASRLFEPFFTSKKSGTGLGLVIAESIAEVHGGHIELVRKVSEGATFELVLPERAGQETG